MPETLTESFCERCGTRYEFTAPTRLNPLRRGRGLVTGLKNYIMSQDALSDTVGDAMRSEAETLASTQLEAFHSAFNFCIDCRQYTCTNCWNDGAGRCRSCAPIAGTDDLIDRFEASFAAQHPHVGEPLGELADSDIGRRLGLDAWPSSDVAEAPSNGHAATDWPADALAAERARAFDSAAEHEPEVEPSRCRLGSSARGRRARPEVEPEPVAAWGEPAPVAAEHEPEVEPEPVAAWGEPAPVAAEHEPEVEPEPVAAWGEPAPVAAEHEPEVEPEPVAPWGEPAPDAVEIERPPLVLMQWEDDSPFDLLPEPEPEPVAAQVEPEPVAAAAEIEPEPGAAKAEIKPEPVAAQVEPEPEPVGAQVEPEPEPVAAPIEPEPEPVAAHVEPEPVAAPIEPEPEPVAAEAEIEPEPVAPLRPSVRPIGDTILRLPRPAPPPVDAQAPIDLPQVAEDPMAAARRAQIGATRPRGSGRGRSSGGSPAGHPLSVQWCGPAPGRACGPCGTAGVECLLGCVRPRGCGCGEPDRRAELRPVRPVTLGERALLPPLRNTPGAARLTDYSLVDAGGVGVGDVDSPEEPPLPLVSLFVAVDPLPASVEFVAGASPDLAPAGRADAPLPLSLRESFR